MPSTSTQRDLEAAYVAAGLYDPATDAETGRLDLLEWLEDKGFSISDMQAALASDSLGAMAGDRHLVPGRRLTRDEAVEASGLTPETFDVFTTAFGLLPIDGSPPGSVGVTEAEAACFGAFAEISSMFSTAEAVGFLRVVGSSLGRLAEGMVSLFLADVEQRMLTEAVSELELAKKVTDAVGLLDGLAAELDPLLRRHVLQAIERSRLSIIGVRERRRFRYAVGFVDLVGFTEISGAMPAAELSEFLLDFEGRAHDAVTRAGARVVKLIGDEVMFVATDAGSACEAAAALMGGFGVDGTVLPRGGLAYGEVLVRGGDYYGSVVNLASRLVDQAVPRELLVTEELAMASDRCRFEPAGRRMVKGFAEPIVVRSLVAP